MLELILVVIIVLTSYFFAKQYEFFNKLNEVIEILQAFMKKLNEVQVVKKQLFDDDTTVFILDRSGSMETCRDDTIGGFNAFLNEQKAEEQAEHTTFEVTVEEKEEEKPKEEEKSLNESMKELKFKDEMAVVENQDRFLSLSPGCSAEITWTVKNNHNRAWPCQP